MLSSAGSNEVEDIVARFPGPVTLVPSRQKWRFMIVLGVGMTIASIFASWIALSRFLAGEAGAGLEAGIVIFGTGFFGLCTAVAVMSLLPGGSWLQLDENGLTISILFRKRKFFWSEVSDFSIFRIRATNLVVFNVATPRPNWIQKRNAGLTGGRNGSLPDTYGLAAADLARIMTEWQNRALRSRGQGETSPSRMSASMPRT
jgi:hypothetical protein